MKQSKSICSILTLILFFNLSSYGMEGLFDTAPDPALLRFPEEERMGHSVFNHLKMATYGIILGSLSATGCYKAEKTEFPLFWCPLSWLIFGGVRSGIVNNIARDAYGARSNRQTYTLGTVACLTDWIVYISLWRKKIQEFNLFDSDGSITIRFPFKIKTRKE